MKTRLLHPQPEDPQVAREIDAIVVERSLWIAQLTAERAGFRDLASEILDVLIKVVDLRSNVQAPS